jgi:hypothetical protein
MLQKATLDGTGATNVGFYGFSVFIRDFGGILWKPAPRRTVFIGASRFLLRDDGATK